MVYYIFYINKLFYMQYNYNNVEHEMLLNIIGYRGHTFIL